MDNSAQYIFALFSPTIQKQNRFKHAHRARTISHSSAARALSQLKPFPMNAAHEQEPVMLLTLLFLLC
jgi:hypothetical protein